MIQLYYYPSTASMIPHILLEEIGVPFERVFVDRTRDANRAPDYLRLNPNGLLPALVDGELVLYETAAIVLHLSDTHPEAGLAPPLGTHERAHFYKWIAWMTNTLQATMLQFFYPERYVREGNTEGAQEVKARAQAKMAGMLEQLDGQLVRSGGPWFLGDRYSALDPYAFTLCRWSRNFSSGRAREYPHLGPYLQRMLARPAVRRVFAAEQLAEPFV